jgi:hypothetical protein
LRVRNFGVAGKSRKNLEGVTWSVDTLQSGGAISVEDPVDKPEKQRGALGAEGRRQNKNRCKKGIDTHRVDF